MTAISVAISTRLPMMANLVICDSIYVAGASRTDAGRSAVGQMEYVHFVANLLATVLPILDHFTVSTISTGHPVPAAYVGWTALYCVLYSTTAMLVALLLFEDRDLA